MGGSGKSKNMATNCFEGSNHTEVDKSLPREEGTSWTKKGGSGKGSIVSYSSFDFPYAITSYSPCIALFQTSDHSRRVR